MNHVSSSIFKNRLDRWNKEPLLAFVDSHIIDYPTPTNISYLWSFGASAGICLVIQIVTGIFLAMHYTPNIELAFNSVEHIMRDVCSGWLIRYIHANGASFFFIVVYLHLFRGLYFNSYVYPRQNLWYSGVTLFFLMMATAFMGYVLPWGQMSLWGATVITNLFSAIPVVGKYIVEWLWGGFSVNNATLNRFFSLHYLMPFLIAAVTLIHLNLLHRNGSNNPLGINTNSEVVDFYPYFYVKDLFSVLILIFVFSFFVFFFPNALGHSDNYILGNPLSTPAHIVPEWYFLPFYAILRSIPDKLGGVLVMLGAIVILYLLPVLNRTLVRSTYFRPFQAVLFWFIFLNFVLLGWIGQKPVETPYFEIGFVSTCLYFIFLILSTLVFSLVETYLSFFRIQYVNDLLDIREKGHLYKNNSSKNIYAGEFIERSGFLSTFYVSYIPFFVMLERAWDRADIPTPIELFELDAPAYLFNDYNPVTNRCDDCYTYYRLVYLASQLEPLSANDAKLVLSNEHHPYWTKKDIEKYPLFYGERFKHYLHQDFPYSFLTDEGNFDLDVVEVIGDSIICTYEELIPCLHLDYSKNILTPPFEKVPNVDKETRLKQLSEEDDKGYNFFLNILLNKLSVSRDTKELQFRPLQSKVIVQGVTYEIEVDSTVRDDVVDARMNLIKTIQTELAKQEKKDIK